MVAAFIMLLSTAAFIAAPSAGNESKEYFNYAYGVRSHDVYPIEWNGNTEGISGELDSTGARDNDIKSSKVGVMNFMLRVNQGILSLTLSPTPQGNKELFKPVFNAYVTLGIIASVFAATGFMYKKKTKDALVEVAIAIVCIAVAYISFTTGGTKIQDAIKAEIVGTTLSSEYYDKSAAWEPIYALKERAIEFELEAQGLKLSNFNYPKDKQNATYTKNYYIELQEAMVSGNVAKQKAIVTKIDTKYLKSMNTVHGTWLTGTYFLFCLYIFFVDFFVEFVIFMLSYGVPIMALLYLIPNTRRKVKRTIGTITSATVKLMVFVAVMNIAEDTNLLPVLLLGVIGIGGMFLIVLNTANKAVKTSRAKINTGKTYTKDAARNVVNNTPIIGRNSSLRKGARSGPKVIGGNSSAGTRPEEVKPSSNTNIPKRLASINPGITSSYPPTTVTNYMRDALEAAHRGDMEEAIERLSTAMYENYKFLDREIEDNSEIKFNKEKLRKLIVEIAEDEGFIKGGK